MPSPNRAATPSSTPSKLDALISAASPGMGRPSRPTPAGSSIPTRPLLELTQATRAIAGWYEYALGADTPNLQQSNARFPAPACLEQMVQHHLALRSEWEKREAAKLVAWMSAKLANAIQEPAQQPIRKSANAPRRALLIDDSSDILVTVSAFLEAYGFHVTAATDGEAALRLIGQQQFHLLVTDHAMPGMTGRDLVLQACSQDKTLRAMIITGYPDLHELKSLPRAIGVLAKPFRRAELFSRLQLLFPQAPVQRLEAGVSDTLSLPSL